MSKTMVRLAVIGILAAGGCKARNASVKAANGSTVPKVDHGLSMSSVDYALESELMGQVGAQLGCDEVSRWFAVPSMAEAKGNLRNALTSIQEPDTDYRKIRNLLFNTGDATAQCQTASTGHAVFGDGYKALSSRAYVDQGRTVLIVVEGFGAEFGADHPLASSIEKWRAQNKDGLIWQIHCEQSFAQDDRCQLDLLSQIAKNEATLPSGTKPHYVIWAYSRGGTGILPALSKDNALRAKTAAVVFAGAPFAGILTPILASRGAAVVKQSYSDLMKAAGAHLALTEQQQQTLSFLTAMLQPVIENSMPEQIKSAMLQIEGNDTFMTDYSPSKRRAVVEGFRGSSSWEVGGRTAMPVYFLSGAVDFPRLRPLPAMALRQGALTMSDPAFDFNSLRTLLFSPLFREFPLSDGVVALEHSIIPKAMLPAGIEGHLAGLMTRDHHQLALVGHGESAAMDEAIADGMLAVIAKRLQGDKL